MVKTLTLVRPLQKWGQATGKMEARPDKIKAAVAVERGMKSLGEKAIPRAKPTDALVRITTITISGTDVRNIKGKYGR